MDIGWTGVLVIMIHSTLKNERDIITVYLCVHNGQLPKAFGRQGSQVDVDQDRIPIIPLIYLLLLLIIIILAP